MFANLLSFPKVTFNWIFFLDKLWENIKNFWKMFEISQNGPLIRGVIKEFIFSRIAWSAKSSTREVVSTALKATQMEDLGLQAILEKMNSLITPLISGPFWDISNIFQKCLIFYQSLSRQKLQLKVTLVVLSNARRRIAQKCPSGAKNLHTAKKSQG